MTHVERQPTDAEIDAVMGAFDAISQFIDPVYGTIQGSAWRDVYQTLGQLSDYELWIGVCNLEEALFASTESVNVVQATLFEIFQISYDQGINAL